MCITRCGLEWFHETLTQSNVTQESTAQAPYLREFWSYGPLKLKIDDFMEKSCLLILDIFMKFYTIVKQRWYF